MPLQRLLLPQSLPPTGILRWLSTVAQRGSKLSQAIDTKREQQEMQGRDPEQPSLLEELFPDESKAITRALSPRPRNDINQLLRKDELLEEFRASKGQSTMMGKDLKSIMEYHNHENLQHKNSSVLVLMNASKSLSLSDFLRLSPKGKHIDGWASGIIQGMVLLFVIIFLYLSSTVIPGRGANILEPQGHYFILFSNDAAAEAYKDQILRLHKISQTYTPSSPLSRIPPPSGFVKDGEDIDKLLGAFTLIPSSQKSVSIRKLKRPFGPSVERLLTEGSHPALATRRKRGDNLVLFSLDRGYVSSYDLRSMIGNDGKERNLHWNLRYIDNLTKHNGPQDVEDLGVVDEEPGVDLRQKVKGRQPPTYILFFRGNQEARRFVRMWHRMPLPVLQKSSLRSQEPPRIKAELLW
jgi:hypothetical protein